MKQIKTFLETEYHIHANDMTLLQDGSDNSVYKITTDNKEKYVLRLCKRTNKIADIEFEADIIMFLNNHGVPVPRLIKTRNNLSFGMINQVPACVFSFCEGRSFDLSLENMPNVQMAENGGRTLARMHVVLSDYLKQGCLSTVRSTFSEAERLILHKDVFIQKYIYGDIFVQEVESILTQTKSFVLNDTIIHNDFRIQNLLFNGDTVSAVLDFDWACIGTGLKDLGHALIEWSFPDKATTCQWDIMKAFLRGYREFYPHIDYEKLLIWMRFSCISDACTYFTDKLHQKEDIRKLNSYMYEKYKFFTALDVASFKNAIV